MPTPWTSEEQRLDAREILGVLSEHAVDFVLVGGVAAIYHGYSAATFDADVVPAVTSDNLARLAAALQALDASIYVDPQRTDLGPDEGPPEADELDLTDPETIRRRLAWYFSTRAGRLDVLLVIDGPGGYATLIRDSVRTRVGDADVAIISLPDLVESKETVGRPKDLAALDELRRLLREQRHPRES